MKYILYLIIITSSVRAQSTRKEITPFIINRIMLKDTTTLSSMVALTSSDMTLHDYNIERKSAIHYLTTEQFLVFQKSIWQFVKSCKHPIIDTWLQKNLTPKEFYDRMSGCDSVQISYYNNNGNEIITNVFECDSTKSLNDMDWIDFYESWSLNTMSGMIDRKIFGYRVYHYIREKHMYMEMFTIYADQESANKVRSYNPD